MDIDAKARLPDERLDIIGTIPYALMHIGAVVGLFFFELTWEAVAVMLGSYVIRMFGITAGFHRYFAHRSFKTGRVFQFILAFLGSAAAQKGVLWWSGLHRHHHRYSDLPEDIHSPKRGFWWSHQMWMLCDKYLETPESQKREFSKYPELLFMDRHWVLPPLAWAGMLALIGGAEWAFWGLVASNILLWHGTFTINSLSHLWGTRRYETTDTSRNNFLLALITLGEGWHNNHHHYQSSANQGFFWYEIDISFSILRVLSWFGIVWDLRRAPDWVLEGKTRKHADRGAPSTYELPNGLFARMAELEALRGRLPEADKADWVDLGAELAQTAADVAKRAANAAQEAAHAVRTSSAADLTARFRESAADAAARAAKLSEEAADSACEIAEKLRDRMSQAWADAARRAAQIAADAARDARLAKA